MTAEDLHALENRPHGFCRFSELAHSYAPFYHGVACFFSCQKPNGQTAKMHQVAGLPTSFYKPLLEVEQVAVTKMRAVRSLSTRGYGGILPQKNLKFEI